MADEKSIRDEQLDQVSGGSGGEYDPSFPSCPKCGSNKVKMLYEHDEIGVFYCDACHHQFTKRYGE